MVERSPALSSLPLTYFHILPAWANVALAGGGLLVAPGSIHEISSTAKWLEEAKQKVADFEAATIPTPKAEEN